MADQYTVETVDVDENGEVVATKKETKKMTKKAKTEKKIEETKPNPAKGDHKDCGVDGCTNPRMILTNRKTGTQH